MRVLGFGGVWLVFSGVGAGLWWGWGWVLVAEVFDVDGVTFQNAHFVTKKYFLK